MSGRGEGEEGWRCKDTERNLGSRRGVGGTTTRNENGEGKEEEEGLFKAMNEVDACWRVACPDDGDGDGW